MDIKKMEVIGKPKSMQRAKHWCEEVEEGIIVFKIDYNYIHALLFLQLTDFSLLGIEMKWSTSASTRG
jgi:hypothetical protein